MANKSESKKYHYIYKTTNLINGKHYIGKHSTNNLNDGYLGSGTYLRRSVKKHGEQNFEKKILEYCDTYEKLNQREKEIVTEDVIKDPCCMNLKPGGLGGFNNEEHKQKWITGREWGRIIGGKIAQAKFRSDEEQIKLRSEKASKTLKLFYKTNPGSFKDKSHTQESRQKQSLTKQGTGTGKENSQYGTCWITNETENKKIKKTDLIPDGWRLGRKYNTALWCNWQHRPL